MRSYDSAPRPSPSAVSRQQVISLSQSSCVSPVQLIDGRGGVEGGERGAKSYDYEKAWSSTNHSVSPCFSLCISFKQHEEFLTVLACLGPPHTQQPKQCKDKE